MNSSELDNLIIKKIIEENNPFFIGRIAGCELKVAYYFEIGKLDEIQIELKELENNAGIFTKDINSLSEYVKELTKSYENCTLIAEWEQSGKVFSFTGVGQEFIANRTRNIPKINAKALEPYYFKDNWMPAFKNKKILIIHPFSKTFKKQIINLQNIFPENSWFENCEIQFIEPPFTLAGNHHNKDWKEHLQEFYKKLENYKEFDIALVGAGGYGMIISNYIFKELGKSVMYIGGALQLFFGVIGKRWFENKEILKLVNDYWIRPSKDDKPDNYIKVEKGCYW
jgi:hypothetical protein